MALTWELFVGTVVRLFSPFSPFTLGWLRMRNGMLRPSVGVLGLEAESVETSFSAGCMTNSLSEKAWTEEIGRARLPALGKSVLDVCASLVSPVELAALLV